MPEETTNIYQLFQKFPWNNLLEINETEQYIKIIESGEYIYKKKD